MQWEDLTKSVRVLQSAGGTHLVGSGKAFEDAQHEFGAALRVAGQADTERVQQHLVQSVGEQGLRQLPQVVLQHAWQHQHCLTPLDTSHLLLSSLTIFIKHCLEISPEIIVMVSWA